MPKVPFRAVHKVGPISGLLAATLLALGLALTGCAQPPAENNGPFICGPDTCTGCCSGNNCIAPPDETACGAGGAACAPCRANEACMQGKCVPDSCAGCVDPQSLACSPGTTATQCGVGGAFCSSCGAGTICMAGKCISNACAGCKDGTGSCQAGTADTACGGGGATCVACTGGQTCQDKACKDPVAVCNSSNCPGCCDSSGMCQQGTATSACGTGGALCATCGGTGATCTSGMCKTPCGPANCAGCCDSSGMCQASTNSTCGNNGVACLPCSGSDICSSGKCISTSCKGTCPGCCMGSTCELGNTQSQCGASGNSCVPCASGQVCNNGSCVVDPNSLWDFIVTSGTVPGYSNSGNPWDSFSYPDPYVELDYMSGGVLTYVYSDYVDNTLTPDWTMTSNNGKVYPISGSPTGIKASDLLMTKYLGMWDQDGVGREPYTYDDDMGYCSFNLTSAQFNTGVWYVTCGATMNTQKVSWTVYFKIVPHM